VPASVFEAVPASAEPEPAAHDAAASPEPADEIAAPAAEPPVEPAAEAESATGPEAEGEASPAA